MKNTLYKHALAVCLAVFPAVAPTGLGGYSASSDVGQEKTQDGSPPAPGMSVSAKLSRAPYLQNIRQDGVTILWRTAAPEKAAVFVERADSAGHEGLFTVPEAEAFTEHEITVRGLLPGTKYRYCVTAPDGGVRGGGTFRTAPDPGGSAFNFVVWGDNQSSPDKFSKISAEMAALQPAFAVGVGDYTDNGSDPARWGRELFSPGGEFLGSVPSFLAAGNHDYGLKGGEWDFSPSGPGAREFRAAFRNPGGNRFYYSFDYGNSHFIVLDPNENRSFASFDVPPQSAQYDWLVRDLESADSRGAGYIFVFLHQPPFSTSWDDTYYDGEELLRRHLVPLLEKYKVSLVFSGHAHVYERGALNGVAYVITGGAGGALDYAQHKRWEHVSVVLREHHFMQISVNGGSLLAEARGIDGNILDSFTLKKRNSAPESR
ncbi:MAG: hypothetical protein A2X28_01185 [Elusimicrobia bacterium GWA2_56_46]|nr:MAG: hypothetical protein A2X28_01185 [Elusimicrobia bacterium GWA2_56_46]OGR53978.1 MAG: hypothetical protein A2X39_09785 [Elusimicrobia bacterium GWC2_56_31]HBB65781.1 hypothetical protein [Elusimicrobiota bacterium]HBW22087.1 hypothetical protein [Elusimicrobiota bacterium]